MASNNKRPPPTTTTTTTTTSTSTSIPAANTRSRRRQIERARTGIESLPNDLIVSIFASFLSEEPELLALSSPEKRARRRSSNLRWIRETFPLVCRGWRDLYYSRNASPLHETLEIDFASEGAVVRAEGVIAWARRRRRTRTTTTTRHAGDVRVLRLANEGFRSVSDNFTSADLATLVEVLGPHLTEIEVGRNLGSLVRPPFWDALRRFVAPAGRLRKLSVDHYEVGSVVLADGANALGVDVDVDVDGAVDVSFLAQLTSLEELRLDPYMAYGRGLRAFPESVLSLTRLRRLDLRGMAAIASLPRGISSLRMLESLDVSLCSLRWLPEELGALTRLTSLDLGLSLLGETAEDVAFPAAALRGLGKSLRFLKLNACRLRSVPSFIGELEALEDLCLSFNLELHDGGFPETFPKLPALTRLNLFRCGFGSVPPAVLSSMPRLRSLDLKTNNLTSLPEALGQRLPELREIDLRYNPFPSATSPLRVLAGAASLEKIMAGGHGLQVDEPLDFLVNSLPRLRDVQFSGGCGHEWTPASRAHFERLNERLQARDRTAAVTFC